METDLFYKNLGQKLKTLRKSYGLTQAELGEHLDITKSAIVNYETGIRKIPLDLLIKMADFYNISVDTLLLRDKTLEDILSSSLASAKLNDKQESLLVGFIEILLGVMESGKSTYKE